MRLPAKIEYACKAVIELALRYNGSFPVQLNTICQSQGIPKKFSIQLLLRLKNARIVSTSRGISGGYYLSRPPSQLTLADIVRAIDTNMLDFQETTKHLSSERAGMLIFGIWNDINKEVLRHLEAIDIESLSASIKREQLTYHI